MTGRPTKCTPEVIEKAKAYIAGDWAVNGDVIPSHVGMYHYFKQNGVGVNRSSLYEWAKDENKGFSDILDACNKEQERILLNMGLKGEFNSNIVKLALGKQGYSDKQDMALSGGDKPIEGKWTVEIVDAKDTAT
tara:strand:- start:2412 stop:2813 length:402 start_codon:yes stop_codon:yes gene_type:complete